jgi:hypothetical protein
LALATARAPELANSATMVNWSICRDNRQERGKLQPPGRGMPRTDRSVRLPAARTP